MSWLIGSLLLLIGCALGWWAHTQWLANLAPRRRIEPLGVEEYEKRRDRLDRAYTESMREYDRLVTWASGGALLASITFVEKLAPQPLSETTRLLAISWGLLAVAFLLSLTSQYASSRVHSWRVNELDHLQSQVETRTAAWAPEAGRLLRGAKAWGKATKWSTFFSGVALVAGMVVLSMFAFQNMPLSAVK